MTDISNIVPEDLLQHVSEFYLPTAASIRRSVASSYGLMGWLIHLDDNRSFLYADGSTGPGPRYRAYEELGLEHGEDDLQGKGDEAWGRLSETVERFTRLLIMDLETAWRLAKENNLAQRRGVPGERFTELASGRVGLVIADYGAETDGPFLRVKFDDAAEDQPIKLARIAFENQ